MLGTLDFLERYNAGQLSEEERAAKTIEAESRGRGCRKKSLADDRGASERNKRRDRETECMYVCACCMYEEL